ncbi:MAG: DNA repair protein RecN [Micavibrio aeruginosavorus]|uniref:DNA repair protein RecN n=1 Tax=Micavibrio aeruginosavorus TaxID=349221 RepID=A0A2W5N593_9BACT|nr:MAG: DNA repair protein RecN [Micavibrio aeruginosavorus]
MLAGLTIKNVVLIDHLFIQFDKGLCALTGETGAGKSILLDSLGLALGARSESGLVRKGEQAANVSAEFDLPSSHPVFAFLKEQGIDAENPLVLRRSVATDGKSRAFLNDHPISVSLLKQIGEMLVEIHGQFDTQTLLNPRVHRGLLDEYAQSEAAIAALQDAWDVWKDARDALEQKRADMERARAEESYLRAALEQLDDLDPQAGEEEKLVGLRSRLMKREQYIENYATAQRGSEQATAQLNTVWKALEKAGEGGSETAKALDRTMAELQEVSAGIDSLLSSLEDSEYSLSEIDDRLFALKAQARKHACAMEELPAKREEISALLKGIEHQEDTLAALEKDVAKAKKDYMDKAGALSTKRAGAAKQLDKLVAKELVPLKLDKARFETQIEKMNENEWGPEGFDRVQFLVATNPGASAGPLNKIASGGEMSRFMLALKVVLAEVGVAQTLVFDEVDSGIGGATADAVGERLARLAKARQILVVTHSPQVAAKAGYHAIVMKTGKTNPTTKVLPLSNSNERTEEIARMLSGAEITKEARAQAAKLLEKAA